MSSGPFRLILSAEAREDIAETARWYDEQEQGLGREFTRAFRAATAVLERSPFIYQEIETETRRVLLRRFPYQVIYKVRDNTVFIAGCFHISRDPQQWRDRMSEL